MNKLVCLLLLISTVFMSCSEEDDLGLPDEEFRGTYFVKAVDATIHEAKIDSVIFQTKRNITYSMLFYKSTPADQLVDFCFCEGTLLDFGTAKVSFDPTLIIRENCDTLRIPKGVFSADFRTHGDTVYIEKQALEVYTDINGNTISRDMIYRLKLIKIN